MNHGDAPTLTKDEFQLLALDHGVQSFVLLESYSHAELVFAAQEIEAWLGR